MTKTPNAIDYVELPAAGAAGVAAARAFYGAAFGWTFKDWGDDYIDTRDSGIGAVEAAICRWLHCVCASPASIT